VKKYKRNWLLKGFTRNILLLGLISLFTDLGSQMVFPLLPLFLTTVIGASASVVGLIEGAATTTAALFQVISGYLSDKFKKRKPFVVFGYSLSSIAKPFFAFAKKWPSVLITRIFERIGKGIRDAPRDALIAETTPKTIRGKTYGIRSAMDGVGSVLGILLSIILLPIFGYKKVFLFTIIPGIITIFLVLLIREKPIKYSTDLKQKQRSHTLKFSFKKLPLNLKLFILVGGIFALGQFGAAFFLLKAKSVGLTDSVALWLYLSYFIAYVLFSIPAGSLSDKFGRHSILIIGFLLFGISCFGLIYANSFISLLIFFILYGISFAITETCQRAYVVDLAPTSLKATALGTFNMVVGLVALPGGYIAGHLWDMISPQTTFIYGIILTIISIILFMLIKKKK
jgi:MFS family permease